MASDTESTREAFGLDLSGFTKRSGLALARRNGSSIELHLIKDHPLDVNFADRKMRWSEAEMAFIDCLVERAPLYVDVPIDLQGLSSEARVVSAWWQLTMRPVDRILKGLAPLASFLGVPVARFRRVILESPRGLDLERDIFETYPAGSLKLIGIDGKSYKKGKITYSESGWARTGSKNDKQRQEKSDRLKEIVVSLGMVAADVGLELDDDALDAILCALTGVVDSNERLEGDKLTKRLRDLADDKSLEREMVTAPQGYVLLCQVPEGEKTVWEHDSYDDLVKCIG